MYDETKAWLDRFWESKWDVQNRTVFDEAIRLSEAAVLIAGFRYAGERLGLWQMNVAYWLLLVILAAYVGNRSSLVASGLIRGRAIPKKWHDWRVYAAGMAGALVVIVGLRLLIDAVVLSTARQAGTSQPVAVALAIDSKNTKR